MSTFAYVNLYKLKFSSPSILYKIAEIYGIATNFGFILVKYNFIIPPWFFPDNKLEVVYKFKFLFILLFFLNHSFVDKKINVQKSQNLNDDIDHNNHVDVVWDEVQGNNYIPLYHIYYWYQ